MSISGTMHTGSRLAAIPRYLQLYFGIPILALVGWGAVLLWQRSARDRVTLATAGGAGACLLFLVLAVLTPVDMRYYLAVIPALALIAATGASIAWTSGLTSRIVAAGLLAWAIVIGVTSWWTVLGA